MIADALQTLTLMALMMMMVMTSMMQCHADANDRGGNAIRNGNNVASGN